MPILLKTQVNRTAKTLVSACHARVGSLCDFRDTVERVPTGSPKTGRCAGVRERCRNSKRRRKPPASGFRQRAELQAGQVSADTEVGEAALSLQRKQLASYLLINSRFFLKSGMYFLNLCNEASTSGSLPTYANNVSTTQSGRCWNDRSSPKSSRVMVHTDDSPVSGLSVSSRTRKSVRSPEAVYAAHQIKSMCTFGSSGVGSSTP